MVHKIRTRLVKANKLTRTTLKSITDKHSARILRVLSLVLSMGVRTGGELNQPLNQLGQTFLSEILAICKQLLWVALLYTRLGLSLWKRRG